MTKLAPGELEEIMARATFIGEQLQEWLTTKAFYYGRRFKQMPKDEVSEISYTLQILGNPENVKENK